MLPMGEACIDAPCTRAGASTDSARRNACESRTRGIVGPLMEVMGESSVFMVMEG
jgi:hypothetical protein